MGIVPDDITQAIVRYSTVEVYSPAPVSGLIPLPAAVLATLH